jgi:hypothetical protein
VLQTLFLLLILTTTTNASDDFHATVKPILVQHCQPCHFAGGKMYDKLPFDRPEAPLKLGTRLFTRIKDRKEKAVIQRFLDAHHSAR